jgi:hypothetical protein
VAFRVEGLTFVEQEGRTVREWMVTLLAAPIGPPLTAGQVLVAGTRRWTVAAVDVAPPGYVAARLDGTGRLTKGLILRVVDEPIDSRSFQANAILLVRLARAMRNVDIDGVIARVSALRAAGQANEGVAGIAKSAILGKHLVEAGATDAELDESAKLLGLDGEL